MRIGPLRNEWLLIIVAVCAGLLSGCTPEWKFEVVNATDTQVSVALGKMKALAVRPGDKVELKILPGSMEEIRKREIRVYSVNGRLLFSKNASGLMESARGAEYPVVPLAIQKDGIVVRETGKR